MITIAASNTSNKTTANYICTGENDEETIQEAIDNITTDRQITFLEGDYYFDIATGVELPSNITITATNESTFKLADGLNADAYFYTNNDKTNGNTNINIIGGIYDCNFRNQNPYTTYQYIADFEKVTGTIEAFITNYTMLEAKLKNCMVTLTNTKFDVDEYVFSNCDDIADFTVTTGTATTETNGGYANDNCIKLTVNTTTTLYKTLPDVIAENYDAYNVEIEIKLVNVSLINSIILGASTGNQADDLPIQLDKQAAVPILDKIFTNNHWITITVPLNRYIINGTPKYMIRFDSLSSTTAYINNIKLVPAPPEPALTWVFDDALQQANDGITLLDTYGHKGSVGQMGETYTGEITGGYMTETELKALNNEGWDVGTHGFPHFHTDVTLKSAVDSVMAVKRYIHTLNVIGSGFYVYSGNDTRGEIEDAIEHLFSYIRNPTINYPVSRKGRISMARQVTSDILSGYETQFLRRHGWLIPYSHGLGGSQISESELTAWAEFWYNWGLISKPPSEIIDNFHDPFNYTQNVFRYPRYDPSIPPTRVRANRILVDR